MSAIKVNLDGLDSSALQIKTLASTLDDLKSSMNGVFSSIDPKIKCRRNIDGSIADIQKKMQMLYTEMNDLSRFISFSKDKYANMEACIAALSKDFRNQIKNQAENDIPWWQTNAFKLAVGTVVTGTAIGLAVIFGGPILIGAAVGAVIGAGIGGVTAGLASVKNGGTFIDGFSDGYMWGSIGGAVSGAIGGTGVGLVGGSLAQGAVNSGTYVGETLQNGGKVSTMGVVGSFGTGAVFYAVGTVAFGKLTEYIKGRPTGNVLNEAKVAGNPEAVGKETEILAKEVSNASESSENGIRSGLKSSFVNNIDDVLAKQEISLDEFNSLRLKDASTLTGAEKATLKAIRESVPMPDADTVMQKVIPLRDIEKYLDGTYTRVGGYVTRAGDVAQLSTYDDIYNSLRLDYPKSAFKPLTDDSVGVIRYTTNEVSKISIPYGKEMGGTEVASQPFTGNGFTKATNGQVIPEFKCDGYLETADGAQLIEISKDGTETLMAIYSKIDKQFIPIE